MRSGWRKGWQAAAGLALLVGTAGGARAGSFDARNVLHVGGPDVLFSESFEDSTVLQRHLTFYDRSMNPLASDAAAIEDHLEILDGALEGLGWLSFTRVRGSGTANLTVDFPALEGRVEVSLWAKASPSLPVVSVIYAPPTGELMNLFAGVTANPTGRRTSDDWVELSTGPLDAQVLGMPLRGLIVNGNQGVNALDALEVRRVGDALFPGTVECSIDNVDADCGAFGDCVFGACVDSALVWGAVPYTLAQRTEYVAREAHLFTREHGNRSAVSRRGTAFLTTVMALATEESPRRFHGGVTRAVVEFRDHHTSPPLSYTAMQGSLPSSLDSESSGALGACFGLTDLDLRGGGTGYTVFRTDGAGGAVGTPLLKGDILIRIDNQPALAWVQRHGWLVRGGAASDPAADPSWNSVDIPGLISVRARTMDVLRCESATSCVAPQTVTVVVNPVLREKMLQAGHIRAIVQPALCDARFTNSVTEVKPPSSDGSDVVSVDTSSGIPTFQFDGFSADQNGAWQNVFATALADHPAHALFDARLGNGGTVDAAVYLVGQLRDTTSPRQGMAVVRPWEALDPEGFYDDLMVCFDATPSMLFDACSGTVVFATASGEAPGASTRVAWLNTADVSANDFVPRMLKGRAGLRIFGPTPTSGAFGAITMLPPQLPGEYMGGSMQIHDTRFGTSSAQLTSNDYESGTGVAPDEVVIQKLSDSLAGKDTLLERARAWLKEEQ